MNVTLTIPDDLSLKLSASFQNVGRTALETLAAKAYEKDVLSLEQVRQLLDLPSRREARALLSQYEVWPGLTVDEILCDAEVAAAAASAVRQ